MKPADRHAVNVQGIPDEDRGGGYLELVWEPSGFVTTIFFRTDPEVRPALQEAADLWNREHFLREHLGPFLPAGLILMTIPDKRRGNRQRCCLTEVGRDYLENHKERL